MTEILPGTKAMRILPGYTRHERSQLYAEDRAQVRDVDREIVRALPWEDGSFEMEVTDYLNGRYYKELVTFIVDMNDVGYSIPSRYLEDVDPV